VNERRLFSYSATAQILLDPFDDKILAANQEACRMLAKDTVELSHTRVSQLFSPSFPYLVVFSQELIDIGRGWCDHLIVETLHGEERIEITGRCLIAGDEQHLHLSFQFVRELDQKREHSDAHRHFMSGIGHWKRVSRAFQEFERENQLILDAAGEGIYGVDAHGMTTFTNPAAEKILGYDAEELFGKNMHTMVHHSHIDGKHFGINDCPIFAAFKDGKVHTVDNDIFWHKSGKAIDVEYTSTPIRDNGFIVGAVVIFRDVSQKKIAEKRLRDALSQVKTLKNRLELEKAYLQEEIRSEFNHHHIIGKSPALVNVMQKIDMVAPTNATVLIQGESGTGKELIARAIHDQSPRAERPLIRVNCAAIPEDLFESEFFGHVKGAFTGATADRPGRFELADGGSLFLDEVGEIPLHLQGKLLRVLQEQQFERIGGSETRRVDVRIIAATNRELTQQVAAGSFREDLYFRLNVFPISSIPLRERVVDIPLLTQHFISKAGIRANKPNLTITIGEMERLKAYHWPGNIRELENVIERQVILATHNTVKIDALVTPEKIHPEQRLTTIQSEIITETELRQYDKNNIVRALRKTKGKVFGQQGAALLLKLKPTTLASRIKRYKIDINTFR